MRCRRTAVVVVAGVVTVVVDCLRGAIVLSIVIIVDVIVDIIVVIDIVIAVVVIQRNGCRSTIIPRAG